MATEVHFRFAINETMLEAVSMSDNELYEIKEKLEVEQEIANCKACSLVAMFFYEKSLLHACLCSQVKFICHSRPCNAPRSEKPP